MTPEGSERLGVLVTVIFQILWAEVNSLSTCAPFRSITRVLLPSSGRAISSSRGSGARARAITCRAGTCGRSSTRALWTVTDSPRSAATARKKAHFLPWLSTNSTLLTPSTARIRPGKPAPLPRSTTRPGFAPSRGRSWAESSTWRRQMSDSDFRLIRFIRWLASHTRATSRISTSRVSRETPRLTSSTATSADGSVTRPAPLGGGERARAGIRPRRG